VRRHSISCEVGDVLLPGKVALVANQKEKGTHKAKRRNRITALLLQVGKDLTLSTPNRTLYAVRQAGEDAGSLTLDKATD